MRLTYIDNAKGILILFVVFGHVWGVAMESHLTGGALKTSYYLSYLWCSFFMPCFFVLTGFCSNLNKCIKENLINNFKTLIIPAFSLSYLSIFLRWCLDADDYDICHELMCGLKSWSYGGPYWFLTSLFLCKILLNASIKFRNGKYVFVVILCSMFTGIILHLVFPMKSFFWLKQTLLLYPFLWFGYLVKDRNFHKHLLFNKYLQGGYL